MVHQEEGTGVIKRLFLTEETLFSLVWIVPEGRST
jgi:hypothetical protein